MHGVCYNRGMKSILKLCNSHAYRFSDGYVLATIVELEVRSFCRRFLDYRSDPRGRQADQMVQAARSGVKNLVEGCERLRTSPKDALWLVDVGRASLCELREDLLVWLMDHGEAPWSESSELGQAVYGVRLAPPEITSDVNREACLHVLSERRRFSQWCGSPDGLVRVNAILILVSRAIRVIGKMQESIAAASGPGRGL